jgi:putative oxidoreductase
MNARSNGADLAGRILLSSIFILSGLSKITDWQMVQGYMRNAGLPLPTVLHVAAIVLEIDLGLGVLLGFKTRWSAALLFLYLIPVTLIFHNFWNVQGLGAGNQAQHFLKNLAILGGLLVTASHEPGRYSLDYKRSKEISRDEEQTLKAA